MKCSSNMAEKEMTGTMAMVKYFGYRPDGYKDKMGIAGFQIEIKELTPEDRKELAEGACKELGVTLKKTS